MNADGENLNLTSEEQGRLDDTLIQAREFHNRSFALALFSFIIAIVNPKEDLFFAYQNINLPKIHTIIGLYFGVILFTFSCTTLFLRAVPFILLDNRRLPFPWIATNRRPIGVSIIFSLFWISLPLLICCLSTSLALKSGDNTGIFLTFVGLMTIAFPRYVDKKLNLIFAKKDERGGKATFSIYLLYWVRLINSLVLLLSLVIPIIPIIPDFRSTLSWFSFPMTILIVLLGVRMTGSFPFIYKFIDKLGNKFGFPGKSDHY